MTEGSLLFFTYNHGVAINKELIGKEYPAVEYEVGLEKIREYAYAVGDENSVYLDEGAAVKAGFETVVAPPMFAVVYSARAVGQAILDPQLGINLMMMVHGEQQFDWQGIVQAGDVITTTAGIEDIYEKAGMDFLIVKSDSVKADGSKVVTARWTEIVRRG